MCVVNFAFVLVILHLSQKIPPHRYNTMTIASVFQLENEKGRAPGRALFGREGTY